MAEVLRDSLAPDDWYKIRYSASLAQIAYNWLSTSETDGKFSITSYDLPTGEMTIVFHFSTLATATHFRLKFGGQPL